MKFEITRDEENIFLSWGKGVCIYDALLCFTKAQNCTRPVRHNITIQNVNRYPIFFFFSSIYIRKSVHIDDYFRCSWLSEYNRNKQITILCPRLKIFPDPPLLYSLTYVNIIAEFCLSQSSSKAINKNNSLVSIF